MSKGNNEVQQRLSNTTMCSVHVFCRVLFLQCSFLAVFLFLTNYLEDRAMNEDFAPIAALDLEPIKVKLMDEDSGPGWSLEQANAAEQEYRRFLYLMKTHPQEPAIPLRDVDQFWHFHILDTMKYAADCQAVFGYFLHHFPYAGMRGKADREAYDQLVARTKALYAAAFHEDYVHSSARSRLAAAPGGSDPRPAWCLADPTGGSEDDTARDTYYTERPRLAQTAQ